MTGRPCLNQTLIQAWSTWLKSESPRTMEAHCSYREFFLDVNITYLDIKQAYYNKF